MYNITKYYYLLHFYSNKHTTYKSAKIINTFKVVTRSEIKILNHVFIICIVKVLLIPANLHNSFLFIKSVN